MDFTSRNSNATKDTIRDLVTELTEVTRDIGDGPIAARAVIAAESASPHGINVIKSVSDRIQTNLVSLRAKLGLEEYTNAQIDAATTAAIMAYNINETRNRTLRENIPIGSNSKNTVTVEAYGIKDSFDERSYAKESYNENDNRSAVPYSITYNLQAARQDNFGETMYPTLTIPPDQAGITITNNILYVMDNVDHDITGAAYDFKRKNLLRAVADPNVLRKDQTRAVPVYRAQNAANFVAPATIPATTIQIDASPVTTAPLLFSRQIDLLSVSLSDELMSTGIQNQTDTLDPTVEMLAFYVGIGQQVLKFNTTNVPYFNFVPNAQQDYKLLTLNADTTSILINVDTKDITGAALSGPLAQIVNSNFIVRMHVVFNGNVRTDTGNIVVYPGIFEVYSIRDADNGNEIALNDPSVATLVAALNGGTLLGWDPLAYRSNANRRQQGQFIDVAKQFQRYIVPLRSPITARHPAHTDGQIDSSDVQALITATRIRIANEAVTTILQASDLLASFVDSRDTGDESPEVLGIGRYYVRPTYIKRDFDAFTAVDSLSSHKRALDIQGALFNQIHDIVYQLYRDSEYKAASDSLYGTVGPMPKVTLATDQYTARYLHTPGDLRTLGGEFEYEVVSTLDYRFRGIVIITFGIFDGDRNTTINPLNNGNLLWAPELVLTANIGRGGQYSRETLVQPRYRFIQNLPVMGVLNVTNISHVLGKIPLNMQDVTP